MIPEDDPLALQNKILQTKGWSVSQKIRMLGFTFYILNQNYNELKKALVAYSKPELAQEISRVGNKKKLNAFLMEVVRRLHNYLAAAISLRDHTHVLVRELYKGTPFEKEYYTERHRTIEGSPQHQFVEQLRNYALHKSIVDTMATTHWDRETGIETSIKLRIENFRAWKGWKGPAKNYLKTGPEEVRLLDLIESYTGQLRAFYEWLGKRQQEIHKLEFGELTALQARYRELVHGFLVGDELE